MQRIMRNSLVDMSFQNWPGASHQLDAHRTETAGLATCAGLFAYRAKHGQLPASLEDLRILGLEPDPSLPWSEMTYQPPTLLVPTKNPHPNWHEPRLHEPWMKVTPEGLEFQLAGAAE